MAQTPGRTKYVRRARTRRTKRARRERNALPARPPSGARPRSTADRTRLVTDPATSARLARIRQQDTSAEWQVRRVVSALGHRYRVRNRDLAGSPDLANRARRWAIFVHGCFWHRHSHCPRATTPKRNRAFWQAKFEVNAARDRRVLRALRCEGWRVAVVWECQIDAPERLVRKLSAVLSGRAARAPHGRDGAHDAFLVRVRPSKPRRRSRSGCRITVPAAGPNAPRGARRSRE